MARLVSCRLDKELDMALEHFARQNRLTVSQAMRELLRQILTDADPVTRGWREGMAQGYGETMEKLQRAMHEAGTG